VFYALPIALVATLTLLELRRGDTLDSNRAMNVSLWVVRAVTGAFLLPLVAIAVPVSLIDGRALPWLLGFALYFLANDLGEYLFHRAQHAIPWLWSLHALHHSDSNMNATTTERHFIGDQFLKAVTIWPAAVLIVKPSGSMVAAYVLLGLWNFVAHSKLPLNFGRLSWLWNSPAYHRRHHSMLTEHHNSNYAALLPIWDVALGSYHRPGPEMPPTGLDSQPEDLVSALTWPLSPPSRRGGAASNP
jgi:sterol desaturase/sphingolipid hydroxylase (fatty acid hydroxylase superfamily)